MKRALPLGLMAIAACGSKPAAEVMPASPAPHVDAAAQVLADALQAKGAKAGSLHGFRMEATGHLETAQGPIEVTIVRTLKVPDKMRVDLSVEVPGTGTQTIRYAIDGDRGWQSTPDGEISAIPDEDLTSLATQIWRDPELVLSNAQDTRTHVQQLPDAEVDGAPCAVIHVVSFNGVAEATLYLDKHTKMLVQEEYPESGGNTVDDFDDFHDDGGVMIAHHRLSKAGADTAELAITKVELDGDVDDAIFEKPAS